MLDIGFGELLVIGAVGLIVLGPKKLPVVTRTVGTLLGRAQRYVSDVKSDIQRQMELEELRKVQQSVNDLGSQLQSQAGELQSSLESAADQVQEGLSSAGGYFEADESGTELSSQRFGRQIHRPLGGWIQEQAEERVRSRIRSRMRRRYLVKRPRYD